MKTINADKLYEFLNEDKLTSMGKRLLDEAFTETPEPKWKPEVGEKYLFLDDELYKCFDLWVEDKFDEQRYKVGNCFKTEADLRAARNKIIEILK